MSKPCRLSWYLCAAWAATSLLTACGGSGEASDPVVPATPSVPVTPITPPPATGGTVSLKPPQLAFTDTGLSVTDGVTRNGLWSVANDGFGWEYSLDQGRTWLQGVGGWFEVKGDGPKMIWVRSKDDAGNTSEIVIVTCVLDTMPPQAPSVSPQTDGITRSLQINGLETGGRWEYSLDEQRTWLLGTGSSIGVLGNGLNTLWLRQVDTAGNASAPQTIELEMPANDAWHEASGNPMQPSVLMLTGNRTTLIHGSVVRGDADYIRWDIPQGQRLTSLRLVHYVSDDNIAFYAIQRASVFDAGVDVNRMLVYGHMGPADLARNVVSALPTDRLGAGPMTLWFQQTGPLPTRYAIEVTVQPLP